LQRSGRTWLRLFGPRNSNLGPATLENRRAIFCAGYPAKNGFPAKKLKIETKAAQIGAQGSTLTKPVLGSGSALLPSARSNHPFTVLRPDFGNDGLGSGGDFGLTLVTMRAPTLPGGANLRLGLRDRRAGMRTIRCTRMAAAHAKENIVLEAGTPNSHSAIAVNRLAWVKVRWEKCAGIFHAGENPEPVACIHHLSSSALRWSALSFPARHESSGGR
jgi:hypothetical protein